MAKYIVLYNPYSGNGTGETNAHKLDAVCPDDKLEYVDMTKVDYANLFASMDNMDSLIICGGDGTLNRFVNDTKATPCNHPIYCFPCGTGNDFLREVAGGQNEKPVEISRYLTNLPTAKVKGKEYLFLNNVGFGIDGYCCQVGDELRAAKAEKIDYTAIAIKGLLGKFKPCDAEVTVDGVKKSYRHCWLAPTMKGLYYGGGMMPTPEQDRLAEDHSVSVMVYCTGSKLAALINFPNIFKGTHIKNKKMVEIFKGHSVHVKFSRPCAVQVDGETILDVTEYEVQA